MKKSETIYVCNECGEEFSKWSGMCPSCREWNTLKELKVENVKLKVNDTKDIKITTLDKVEKANFKRIATKIKEFDRVLGGGIVPGSVILLGGDPGIGKSTITAQILASIDKSLYVSGEESLEQIRMRIDRLRINPAKIQAITETNIAAIIKTICKYKPSLAVIDSIQTMYSADFPSTPGSLVQVRECALKLQKAAKELRIPIILIGHVTKEGNVAGPKILEHLVDVVLYLEGERFHNHRILRGVKNRFGAIDEIGVFEMSEKGMIEVVNPSKIFLAERNIGVSGSVVTAAVEGNRPILVEIQALVTKSNFGYPKRTTSGFDLNRLNLLLAILAKRGKLQLGNYDVYVNIVGGFKIKDPGIDLAVCMAIASAFLNKKVSNNICLFGEVGLSGEIRQVRFAEKRKEEAVRLGFDCLANNKFIINVISEIFQKS